MRATQVSVGVLTCALTVLLSACGGDAEPSGGGDTGPSAPELASAGEAAFFDTLWGVAERDDETLALLERAVAKNRRDGRSYFLLGMMHMFRYAQNTAQPSAASPAAKRELAAAQAALDKAVPLLPEDRRVPGFRGAATYTNGVVTGDARLTALGLAQLRDSIRLYPEFNSFSFLGTVAQFVSRDDPLFAEAMEYLGDPLTNPCSPFTQPQICGNAGKAPRNVEGAMVLFGDLFAKAGNMQKARAFYLLGLGFPGADSWRFRALAQERLDTVAERIARYEDRDPTNDPPLVGYREEACAVCHFR